MGKKMKMKQKVEKKSKMYVENDPFSRVIVILTIQSETSEYRGIMQAWKVYPICKRNANIFMI